MMSSIDACFEGKEWKNAIEQLDMLSREGTGVGNMGAAFEKELYVS